VSNQIIKCPLCQCTLEWQRLKFWRCPGCEAELWPDMNKLKQRKQEQKDRERAETARRQALLSVGTPTPDPLPAVNVRDPKKKSSGNRRKSPKKPIPRLRSWELF
jgi:hypothetical protein